MNKIYNNLMKKCFLLAKKAKMNTLPNPLVGAIIYDEKKDEIISSGYHQKYGEAHAEVNAIMSAKKSVKNKTLIVNLEPCSHFGKTPPCADLIIKSGIKKVVIGMVDINEKVKGNGIKKLQEAGIEVIYPVLENESRELNKVFIKNIIEKKPYIMLKTATTLDAKIATSTKKSKWITNSTSRNEVQKLRAQYQAIMSASGTILADNPMLNVRLKGEKSPVRIIFDLNSKIPFDYNVFNNDGTRIILITSSKNISIPSHIEKLEFVDFDKLFKDLFKLGIYSIMIEAGSKFNSLLLKSGEVDEINQFFAPKIFGSGLQFVDGIEIDEIKEAIELKDIKIKKIKNDFLVNGKIKK